MIRKHFPRRPWLTVSLFTLSVCIVAFVAIKAATTSFTHDESITYNNYVHQSFMDIVSYATPYTNNHILNTLCMKWSEACFGPWEWALRLHSVLALAGYLICCVHIVRTLPFRMQLAGFVLLVANPYLLDFFGLARGYGLSFCFMMLAVRCLLRSLQSPGLRDVAVFNIACLLAACSNFAMINFYLGALAAFYLVQCLQRRVNGEERRARGRYLLHSGIIHFLFALATTLILWEPIRKTREAGVLDFGGKDGFVADTVASLIRSSLYYAPPVTAGWIVVLGWAAAASVLLSGMYWIFSLLREGAAVTRLKPLIAVNTILLITSLAIITQHFMLHNDYFIGRFALFLFPLFILNLLFWWTDLSGQARLKNGLVYTAAALAIAAAAHTVARCNGRAYFDWDYDQDTKSVMASLKLHHHRHFPAKPVRMGIVWHFEPTVNFYRTVWHLTWLQPADRRDIQPTDDYVYDNFPAVKVFYPGRQELLFHAPSAHYCLVYNTPAR